jgi:hypothetical protein
MKYTTLASFWGLYGKLDWDIRATAKKAFHLWSQNPFHPSLRFKCINKDQNIWSVRVTLGYRALGVLNDDTVTWFWIGNHDAYKRFFG